MVSVLDRAFELLELQPAYSAVIELNEFPIDLANQDFASGLVSCLLISCLYQIMGAMFTFYVEHAQRKNA